MAAIDIVHELPNPYDRLKLEIVGSCFALHPAKMANPADESNDAVLKLDFDRRLMLQFCGLMPGMREPAVPQIWA
jgi:hypothetical protein